MKERWPTFPDETGKPPSQALTPNITTASKEEESFTVLSENKPGTPELFKAGVIDAVCHKCREARHCRWDTRRPNPGWFTDLTPSG